MRIGKFGLIFAMGKTWQQRNDLCFRGVLMHHHWRFLACVGTYGESICHRAGGLI